MKRVFLDYTGHFDAAHYLRGYEGICSNLHGHRWDVEIRVSGKQLNDIGILIDFKSLKQMMKDVLPDHKSLNEINPFKEINPTAENLVRYFFDQFEKYISGPLRFAGQYDVRLERVRVWESPGACAMVERGSDE